jgi:hypothetical protein
MSVKGRLKTSLNALPALGVGALAVLLAIPLCTPGLQHQVQGLQSWRELHNVQALVISVSTLLSLLFLWMQRKGSGGHGDEKHGKGH